MNLADNLADQTVDDFEVIAAVSSEAVVKPTALDIGFDIDDSVSSPEGQLSLALLTGNLGSQKYLIHNTHQILIKLLA